MPAPGGPARLSGPVAVTGASGRLGRAVVAALHRDGFDVRPWSRPAYDLDQPGAAARSIERDRPRLVVHTAAWTDVDGCARDPVTARRRNADAVGELAAAAAAAGSGLVHVSTNEVFDGKRRDGRGYVEGDPPGPVNPYGESKLAGERLAHDAYRRSGDGSGDLSAGLWIVRTSWLFGPPGNDFPARILAARDRLAPGEALRVVTDEIGTPTYTNDLAAAILELVRRTPRGTYHLVNEGHVSRYGWAREVLRSCRRDDRIDPIESTAWERPSRPPAWGVLDPSAAASLGIGLRPWQAAFADYAPSLCPR
jgi:dTDP-4-dehydrorhamnose reductase